MSNDDNGSAHQFIPGVIKRQLSGNESIINGDGSKVLEYWRWAYSDVYENIQRGMFAEFIVATALQVTHVPRIGWNPYDLSYGIKNIEVKCSSYLQSWKQRALSEPQFQIGARRPWVEETGLYEDPRYGADCFVFCLYKDKDGPKAEILDLNNLLFYPVGISDLIAHRKDAKSISLRFLESVATGVKYEALKEHVDGTLEGRITLPPPKQSSRSTSGISPIRPSAPVFSANYDAQYEDTKCPNPRTVREFKFK